MFEADRREGLCRLACEDARWLATGIDGGYVTADDAVNLTVPTGFDRTDLATYVAERRADAGCPGDGPALLTGVDQTHACGVRAGSVTVLATAGLSNPASLPLDRSADSDDHLSTDGPADSPPPPGTVNLLVGTARALGDGPLAALLATAVEAKTATLTALTGFSGTTSDAVAVGCNPNGESATFAGSGTDLGKATRACVRDAVRASLASRYPDGEVPESVDGAAHGAVTERSTTLIDF